MSQVMPMSWRLTKVANRLSCQLIRFLDSIQTQQTKACLLGHLRRLELHVVTLKDSTAPIEEEQCLTIMPLSRINQSDVQCLPSYRNLLSLVPGKRVTGLLMQSDRFTKSAHSCKSNGLVRLRTGYIEIYPFALYSIGFNSTIKESQCLIILPRFVVYDGSIHINLPCAQVLSIAYKDFVCCSGTT